MQFYSFISRLKTSLFKAFIYLPIVLDIFNEIISEFDFGDHELNINTQTSGSISQQLPQNTYTDSIPNNYFENQMTDDPLLSSANTNINYNLTQATIQSVTHDASANSPVLDNLTTAISSTPATQIYCSSSTPIVNAVEQASTGTATTVVYHIANNNICTPASSPALGQLNQTTHILNHVSPIQMVTLAGNNLQTRPQQKYRKILEKNPPQTIQLQASPVLNSSQYVTFHNQDVIDSSSSKPILINPTVMYTTAAATGTTGNKNGAQVMLLNAAMRSIRLLVCNLMKFSKFY